MAFSNSATPRQDKLSRKKLSLVSELKKQAFLLFDETQNHQDHKVRQQALKDAKNFIAQALNIAPLDGDSLNLLARIELEVGQLSKAHNAIEQALAEHSQNAGYWYSAGHVALAMNNLSKAEDAFKQAITLAPNQTRAEVSLAYTLVEQGRKVEAFQLYRQLVKTHSSDIQIRSRLLHSAQGLVADYYDPELEQDLISYLNWDDLNLNQLSHLCCSVLIFKFQLSQQGSASSFNDMANSVLLLKTLRHTIVKNELLEKLLIALRQELLSHASKKGRLINQYIPLCEAICQYALNNEFLMPYTEAERSMVLTLKNMIEQSLNQVGCTPTDISGALMLFAMYESWYTINNHKSLFNFDNDGWPAISFDIKQAHDRLLHDQYFEFNALTNISQGNTHEVKTQYERFPYPRWQFLDNKNATNYGRALQHEFPWISIPESILTEPLDILVAGCGTGRHALNVAKYFYRTNVTALDISQTSLNYAYKKSTELNIENIEFFLADLTLLPKLNKSFDIVECSGVLHHIKEYQLALDGLLTNLKPNGFLKLSLYSKRARTAIYQIRKAYKHGGIEKNEHDIRILRHVIFADNKIEDKHLITESDDFYSMSGVVDLLLHEYEIGFSPKAIKALCEANQLMFLGFSNLDTQLKEAFKLFTGADYALDNLDQWEAFEKVHPNTFSAMFQFYCQYKPQLKSMN
ncbi:MAG: ubiquinone/menaquinone biosynthesis C-methylase UbiE [Oceanicoccus sp.]|jgi:ubiquinone/menaquinone biosynthesis C-methylase UbiE